MPDRILAEQARQGVHCLPVPTPFAVGRVNCYLLEGDPLTLIDAGPRSERSLTELESLVEETGHRIEDIGLVVATHQHIDHIGLISTVVERSGAEVAALDKAVARLAEFGSNSEAEDNLAVSLMLSHGVPEDIARTLPAPLGHLPGIRRRGHRDPAACRRKRARDWRSPAHRPPPPRTQPFRHGLLGPGAAHGLRRRPPAVPHLLEPADFPPPGWIPGRTRSLVSYNESLARTRAMPIDLMLSGHGDPITDHAGLIDSRMAAEERRLNKIERIIAERPRTAHAVAEEIWGNVAVTQGFLTLSEVIGHTDILQDQGRVIEREENGLLIFEAVG